ncbi:hypothetical protein [Microbacterium immunditiarum]|uniref:Beta-lactamase regulating signal transducer with metallopeptidase domain n=1 Tax=Microbacterium immunditiarum TaxID=337480 RepID=A0A7Y9GQ40_9MICO|nr:hypothetical protein [Microbacterium immunditiarum]NYE20504.1 beta-lactamase regulating signal transducer with metallopeptidase domain [Microbacterium immunditiarum]
MDEFMLSLIVWVVGAAVSIVLLYWIVRLAVRHALAERTPRARPSEAVPSHMDADGI